MWRPNKNKNKNKNKNTMTVVNGGASKDIE
jgi:hypothetical protein